MRMKKTPRDAEEINGLKVRIHKIQGQISGIEKMIEENRYCRDVLVQLQAAEAGLKKIEYMLLKTHMETCMKEKILEGDEAIIDETYDLITTLKK